MKKTWRKLAAIILTVIMVMSVAPIHSFAAVDITKLPKIESIRLSDSSFQYVSMKSMDRYVAERKVEYETPDEFFGINWSDIHTFEEFFDMGGGYSFYTCPDVPKPYEYEITLTNGRKVKVEADSYRAIDISPFYSVEINNFGVRYADYIKAKEEGAEKVELTFEAYYIFDVFGYGNREFEEYKAEINVVPCFVESFEPVSEMPGSFYDFTEPDISGVDFKIKYADGTEKVLKPEKKRIEYGKLIYDEKYYIDGYYIYNYIPYDSQEEGKSVIRIEFLDEVYEKEITIKESPFESIEITECDLHPVMGLRSITYKVTWKNGESKEYSKRFYDINDWYDNYGGRVATIDGADAYILSSDPGVDYEDFVDEEGKSYVGIYLADCNDCVEFDFELEEPPMVDGYISARIAAIIQAILVSIEMTVKKMIPKLL